mgnify:FL=1
MNITPLRDRIVLKPIKEETVSSGGIVLNESSVEKPFKGEVVAVGEWSSLPNGDIRSSVFQVGYIAVYRKGAGTEVLCDDGIKYLVCHEDEIVCLLGEVKK